MSLILLSSKTFQVIFIRQKKNTLVSRNASDEKNLRPGGRKFIFLKSVFRKYSLFFFSFFCCCFLGVFLYSCFFLLLFLLVCIFFEIKSIYSDTRSVWEKKHFHPADFREQNCFFFGVSGAIIDRKESKDPAWYKNFANSCIDLLLTKSGKNTTGTCTIEMSISNFWYTCYHRAKQKARTHDSKSHTIQGRSVTRGERGEVSPALFQELKKVP